MSYKEELETIKVQLKEGILEAVFNVIQDNGFAANFVLESSPDIEKKVQKLSGEIAELLRGYPVKY